MCLILSLKIYQKKTRGDPGKLSANYLFPKASFKCQDFFRLLFVPQYLNNNIWCWFFTFSSKLLKWYFWKQKWKNSPSEYISWAMRIQPRDNHLQTTGVTKPEDNNEDFKRSLYHFYATLWVHFELLLQSSMNSFIIGYTLAGYTSIIFKDFLKNAEKLHLKIANGITNNSLVQSLFVYCECLTHLGSSTPKSIFFHNEIESWTNPNMVSR